METDEYAIQEWAESEGLNRGDTLLEPDGEWKLQNILPNLLTYSHTDGVEIHIVQNSPEGTDLPFEVLRETPAGDQYQIGESDWFNDAFETAHVYALGYVEG